MPERSGDPVIRVLYVDDDYALVRLVQRTLGRRGFEVDHADNAEDAFDKIAAGGVQVVALDHYLPGGTGLDFLQRLALSSKPPAVVYVTGSSEMSVAVAALKAGASDFVPKTVGEDFLILLQSAIEQAAAKQRLLREKEAAEQEVRAARDRAEVLLAEVNHRVANSLALVAAMVSLQAKSAQDGVIKDVLAETQSRIFAISLVHRRLYSAGDVRFVELNEYLAGLLDHLEDSTRDRAHGITLRRDLEPVRLRTDASINLGVVVVEWITNALKYAYPERGGEVRIRMRALDADHGELTVSDDGVGRGDTGTVKGTGLGTKLVTAMASSMQAEVQYVDRTPGTTARLVFPLQTP